MNAPRKRHRSAKLTVIATINQILATPEQWTNSAWHCGSKHCFFGWADLLTIRAAGGTEADIPPLNPDLMGQNPTGKQCLKFGQSYLQRIMDITATEAAWIADDKRTIQEHYAFAVAHVSDIPTILKWSLFETKFYPEFEDLLRQTTKLELNQLKPLEGTTIPEDGS